MRQRHGLLVPRPWHRLASLPAIGPRFGPRDLWWRMGDPRAMEEVVRHLGERGIPFLEVSHARDDAA